MKRDLSALSYALSRLREGLQRHQCEPADELLRDGLVQRFERAYELSQRVLRAYVTKASASPSEIQHASLAELIGLAHRLGFVRSEWPTWRGFREMRIRTTHVYHPGVATEVVAAVPAFLEEAEYLLSEVLVRRQRCA